VSPYEQELRDCLGVILGERPPLPDYEAFVFYKQWLAERNLGLVPIAKRGRVRLARPLDCPGSIGGR